MFFIRVQNVKSFQANVDFGNTPTKNNLIAFISEK